MRRLWLPIPLSMECARRFVAKFVDSHMIGESPVKDQRPFVRLFLNERLELRKSLFEDNVLLGFQFG